MARTRWRWLGEAVVVAAVTLAAAPGASAAWTSPFGIGRAATPQQLGPIGAGGDVAVLTWTDCARLRFDSCTAPSPARMRTRSFATGRLGPVQSLTALDTDYGPLQLAVATNGDAVFAWRGSDGVHARRLTRGVLGPIVALTTEAAWVYEPAIGAGGDAVFAWMVGTITIGKHMQARTLSASGALGPLLDIPTPGQGTGVPGVGVGAGGDVVVAWDDQGCRCAAGAGEHVRRLLVRSASPASGRVGEIAEPWTAPGPRRPERAIYPSVLVDRDGDALVSWTYSPRNGNGGGDRQWARTFSASGALGPTITATTGTTAMAPSGAAATIWRYGSSLRARTISPAGRVGRTVVLGGIEFDGATTIAMSPAGTAVIAWERRRSIVTRSLSARGRLGPLVRVARAGDVANPRIPAFPELTSAAGAASNVIAWRVQRRWMPQAAVDAIPARSR